MLRRPINNIATGDAPPGRFTIKQARITATRQLNQGEKYNKAMSLLKSIASVMAERPAAGYDELYKLLSKIVSTIEKGGVPHTSASRLADIRREADRIRAEGNKDVSSPPPTLQEIKHILDSQVFTFEDAVSAVSPLICLSL